MTSPWDHGNLSASPDGRHLQHRDGTPFFYMGDTAWEMINRSTREEVELYMADRREKKFNVIMTVCYAEFGGPEIPNAYGHLPVLDGDAATPNPSYFEHVDFVIDTARRHGLYVGLLPCWGNWTNLPGEKNLITPDNAERYGRWLGERYRDRPNIIWILGGDRHCPWESARTTWHRCARGIALGINGREDYRGLCMSWHARARSSHAFHHAPWLTFNMLQSAHWKDRNLQLEGGLLHDYFLEPPKPCMDSEPVYEEMVYRFWAMPPNADPSTFERADSYYVRKPRYSAVLAGGCGTVYGCNDIWQWYSSKHSPIAFANRSWKDSLDLDGASQMQWLRLLFEHRPWHKIIPSTDWYNTIVVTGLDAEDHGFLAAATSTDRSFAMVYSSEGVPFMVVTDAVHGPTYKAWWFDPRNGQAREAGRGRTSSEAVRFEPPSRGINNDWMLVIDSEDAHLEFPGA
jgi:hypothetical protein